MKVGELIERLKEFDSELDVTFADLDYQCFETIKIEVGYNYGGEVYIGEREDGIRFDEVKRVLENGQTVLVIKLGE